MRGYVSPSHKTAGKIIVVYTLVFIFLDTKLEDTRFSTEWYQVDPDLNLSFISSWKVFWFVEFVLKQTTQEYSLTQPIPRHRVTETNRFWASQLFPLLLCKPTVNHRVQNNPPLWRFLSKGWDRIKCHYSCPTRMVQSSRVRTQSTALTLVVKVQWHHTRSMRSYSDNKGRKFPFPRRASRKHESQGNV